MASQWPRLHAALVATLPTLPGWSVVEVFDGPPVTGNVPTSYCTVGHAQLEDSAGSYETTLAGNGFQLEESGLVRCELVVFDGGTDVTALRVRAFGLLDALDAAIRANRTFGVLSPEATTDLAVDVVPVQSQAGAVQRLPFSVLYFTRS